ncbi:MAG: G1 family endopeptidase [Chloroflexota bacterium]|nr:G1 family endopeptidase [Chloroflexota bacterium]
MRAILPEDPDPREQLASMNVRARRFQVPDEFDPLTASEKELEEYGFPPRPDQATQPELYAFWLELFSRPLTYVEADFSLALPDEYYSQSAGAPAARSRHEASLNWSGAYVTPRDGRMFTQVLGSWHVPTVVPPPGGSPAATYGSSTWIGLDGQRSYLHSTLPQIGTGQFLNLIGIPGSKTEAWIQWWPRCPVTLGMRVVPGDRMMAWLIVLNSTDVFFMLANYSRGLYSAFVLTAPMVTLPPHVSAPVQANVSGATAEWVMERPAPCPHPDLFDLPDYSPVVFNNCYAVSAPAPGGAIRVETLAGARLIRMYAVKENPHRTVTVSVAEQLGPHQVKTSYLS